MSHFWDSESLFLSINNDQFSLKKENRATIQNNKNYTLESEKKETLALSSGKRIAGIALGCLCTLVSLGTLLFFLNLSEVCLSLKKSLNSTNIQTKK